MTLLSHKAVDSFSYEIMWKSVFWFSVFFFFKVKYCSSNLKKKKKKVTRCCVCYVAVVAPAASYSPVYRAVAFSRYVSFPEKLVIAFAYFLCRAFNTI